MRKLKLQMQLSLDSYVAGPNGEMDWMTLKWDEELKKYVGELTEPVDTIVLGRKLAEGFIPYWGSVAGNPEDEQHAAGKKFTETRKVVFTKAIDHSPWANTELANGDLKTEIRRLKGQAGKDIIAYGGARFASSLIQEGLVDEYHLFVNPTAIGAGMPIFQQLPGRLQLNLAKSIAFGCGIVVMHYHPKANV